MDGAPVGFLAGFLANLLQFDRDAFIEMNSNWTNAAFDFAMPIITDLHKQILVIAFMLPLALLFWVYKSRARAAKAILAILLAAGAADLLSYRVLKANVQRPRPEAAGVQVRLLVNSSSGTSFPSNHASNMFAIATLLWLIVRRWSWLAFVYATAVAYSRVYVGVHYPLDVLAGAGVGALSAYLVWLALRSWIDGRRAAYERASLEVL